MKKAKDVKEYIENSAEKARPVMKELQKIIRSTVPDAEERIAWNVPNYKLNEVLTGFAAYSKHVSVGFSESGLSHEEREMFENNGYKTGKRTVQIRFEQEVPSKSIKKVLKSHAKINATKMR